MPIGCQPSCQWLFTHSRPPASTAPATPRSVTSSPQNTKLCFMRELSPAQPPATGSPGAAAAIPFNSSLPFTVSPVAKRIATFACPSPNCAANERPKA